MALVLMTFGAMCDRGDSGFHAWVLRVVPTYAGKTIPDFHNMELRLRQLREAVTKDMAGRVKEVTKELELIEAHADEMCLAERLHREGVLPKRICHCDTKVNNMLFDRDGNVLCIIDLDTVMPAYIFSDYGDFLRTAALRRGAVPFHASRPLPHRLPQRQHLLQDPLSRAQPHPHPQPAAVL